MTRQTILFAVLVAVGLAAAWWALLYNPMSATIAETYGQADTTRTQVAAARSDLAELERVADNADALQAIVDQAQRTVPVFQPDGEADPESLQDAPTDVDEFLRHLATLADDNGVSWDATEVSPPGVSPRLGEDHPELAVQPITVTASGTYRQLADFLEETVDPEVMPRGVVWADVALASDSVDATGTDYVLTGNLELYSLLTPVTDETDEPAPAPSETDAG